MDVPNCEAPSMPTCKADPLDHFHISATSRVARERVDCAACGTRHLRDARPVAVALDHHADRIGADGHAAMVELNKAFEALKR